MTGVQPPNGEPSGTLATHADTTAGSTTTTLDTGTHGDELADWYGFDFTPSKLTCYQGAPYNLYDTFNILWRAIPDPGPERFLQWDGSVRQTSLIVRTSATDYGAIDHTGNVQLVANMLGSALQQRLSDPTLVWANSVEPYAAQGSMGAAFPVAIALSADGSHIIDRIVTDGASLLADGDRGVVGPPTRGSPHAAGYTPVLSRFRRGVFVAGGTSLVSTAPTGQIWFTTLDSNIFYQLRGGWYQPEQVLAATYSYVTDELYVLDATSDGNVRLVSVDFMSWDATLIGTWQQHTEWDRHSLVIDRDGGLILASSSTSKNRHAIAKLRVGKDTTNGMDGVPPNDQDHFFHGHGAHGGRIQGIHPDKGSFAFPPVVDADGYTLVFRQDKGNGKVDVDRVTDLGLAPSKLSDIGNQL